MFKCGQWAVVIITYSIPIRIRSFPLFFLSMKYRDLLLCMDGTISLDRKPISLTNTWLCTDTWTTLARTCNVHIVEIAILWCFWFCSNIESSIVGTDAKFDTNGQKPDAEQKTLIICFQCFDCECTCNGSAPNVVARFQQISVLRQWDQVMQTGIDQL